MNSNDTGIVSALGNVMVSSIVYAYETYVQKYPEVYIVKYNFNHESKLNHISLLLSDNKFSKLSAHN